MFLSLSLYFLWIKVHLIDRKLPLIFPFLWQRFDSNSLQKWVFKIFLNLCKGFHITLISNSYNSILMKFIYENVKFYTSPRLTRPISNLSLWQLFSLPFDFFFELASCQEKLRKRTPRCNFTCIFPLSDSVLFHVSSFLTSYIIFLFFLKKIPTFPIPTLLLHYILSYPPTPPTKETLH